MSSEPGPGRADCGVAGERGDGGDADPCISPGALRRRTPRPRPPVADELDGGVGGKAGRRRL